MNLKFWKKEPAKESLTPEQPTKIGKAVISTFQSSGSSPTSTFAEQIKVFKKDSIVRESIIHTAMEIIGTGIFTSTNEKYGLVLAKPKKDNEPSVQWTAKEAIDFWNQENNLDEKGLTVAIEMVAYGNSFWKITPSGLQVIPIDAISRALPNSKEKPITEAYDLELSGVYTPNKIKWGEFVHFRVNVTSSSSPFGTGIIVGLIETYDEDAPSLLDTRNTIRTALAAGFAKFGNPNEIWSFPDLSDEALGDGTSAGAEGGVSKSVKDLPDTGSRLTVNTPATITTAQTRRDTGWEAFISQMADEFIMSLGDPSLKASIESGFTEASIRGSIELFRKKILAFRRAIKRIVESMWSKVLKEYGFDPEQAQVKLNFGAEEIEWVITDLISAVEKGIVSKDEARQVLMKKVRWELTGSAPITKTPEATPQ
jgi:hypothetical protein